MSLGWGKVTAEEWAAAKAATLGSDDVPNGDYMVEATSLRHIEPKDEKHGAYIVSCLTTTDGNPASLAGKKLELRFQYNPNPKTDGIKTMNAISLQNAIQLIEAARVEPQSDPTGALDIPGTLGMICTMKAKVIVEVTRRKDGDKTYVDVVRPRPLG